MKFMRRPDLDTQTRIHIVLLAWLHQGVYGKMTQIAAYYRISRTFLYQLLITANLHLEILFSDEKPLMGQDPLQFRAIDLTPTPRREMLSWQHFRHSSRVGI